MNNKGIVVSIKFSTIIKSVLFIVLLYLLYYFHELVLSVLTAIVIASIFEPIIDRLEKIKLPRIFAVFFTYIAFLSVIFGFLFFFTPKLIDQVGSIYQDLPQHIQSLYIWTDTKTGGNDVILGVITSIQNQILELNLTGTVGNAENSSETFMNLAISIFGSVFNFILIFVLSFYFASQKHGVENFLKIVTTPKYTKYAINLWKRSQKKIGRWMQGQLVSSLIIGVITYLGLLVFFGFEQSLFLAVLAAVSGIVPVIGFFIAAIPAIAIGLAEGGVSIAIGVALLYLVIQMIENQLIYPLVIKKIVGVPAFLVIISLIVGAQLFGFWGIILSIPIAAALMEFIKDIEKKQDETMKSADFKEVHLARSKK